MATKRERRDFHRRSLNTTILFRPVEAAGGSFRSGQMRDISDGGVSFDTDDPPTESSLVDMFFKEHTNAADRRVRGRVIWARPSQAGFYTIGVGFET